MTRGLIAAGKRQKCIDRSLGFVQPKQNPRKNHDWIPGSRGGRRRERRMRQPMESSAVQECMKVWKNKRSARPRSS